MPHVTIPASPVAPGRPGPRIYYRERGAGPGLVILHGGWGYEAYPFDAAIAGLATTHRVVAPDRVGFGGSARIAELPRGFHRAMAEETLAVMDALDLPTAAMWGHSDGAVVAAWVAIVAPERVRALVLEALHHFAAKPGSLAFFRAGVEAPASYGARALEALARDHGASWREVVAMESRAWLDIIDEGLRRGGDVYHGRLGEVRAPTLLLHGLRDPRTEPGELSAARRALPHARCELLDAGHSPHTSAGAAARCVELAAAFLDEASRDGAPP